MIRLKPLVAPFLKRIRPSPSLEREIIQPQETETIRPPSLLPEMLERVTATPIPSELQFHINAATACEVTHAPVVRWSYRDVLVYPSGYATWSTNDRNNSSKNLKEFMGPLVKVPKLRYCHDSFSCKYFGHWMSDALPKTLIESDDSPCWLPPNQDWQHANDYLDTFNLFHFDAHLVHAKEMVVYQDFAQGSHKRARYSQMRNTLRESFGNLDPTDRVYLRRGATGKRRLVSNEEELIDKLVACNWKIVDIEGANVSDLQRAICKAKVVVGMEGSHLNHAQFGLAAGCSLIILTPHDRFTTIHVGRAIAKQILTGIVVLLGDTTNGYHVDIDEIFRTIELTISNQSTTIQ